MKGNDRRAFLKNGMLAAGAATLGAGLLPDALGARLLPGGGVAAMDAEAEALGPITKGDIAILNYALTLEYLEAAFYKAALAKAGLRGADDRTIAQPHATFGLIDRVPASGSNNADHDHGDDGADNSPVHLSLLVFLLDSNGLNTAPGHTTIDGRNPL